MKILFVMFVVCFTLGLASLEAAKIEGGNSQAKRGGTLVYEAYEPNHLNPISFNQAGSIEVLSNWVFEKLVDTDVISGEDIPLLAKKWVISPDGKTFTFTIDERAKWFDSKPVTALDVKFSFEVFSMEGADAAFRKAMAQGLEKIEIVDNKTVRFVAKEKLFSNFEFITSTIILPKHLYYHTNPEKLKSNEHTKQPKGSGPYLVQSFEKGNGTVLVKNPNYWARVLPQNQYAYNFDRIEIKYIRDAQMAFEKLKKGDLDYMPIRIGNTELWRQTKTDKAFTSGKVKPVAVSNKYQQGYGFIGFNLRSEIFKDINVRKALGLAINREEIIKKSLDGMANIPFAPLFSVDNFEGKFVPQKFNQTQALELLAKSGWADSDGDYVLDKNGKKFQFAVLVPNARIEKEMLFVQDYWKQIGVDVTVKILEYSTWKQLQNERKFDALSNGKNRSFMAKGVDAYGEWHSDNDKPGLNNFYGFRNAQADKLILEARSELNAKKRKKLLSQVDDIIANEYVMFLYSESKASLHGIQNTVGLPSFQGKIWYPYDLGMKYWWKN